MYPKFDLNGVRSHDTQIMTAFHVNETAVLTTQPSVASQFMIRQALCPSWVLLFSHLIRYIFLLINNQYIVDYRYTVQSPQVHGS